MAEPSRRREGMQRIRVGVSGLVGVLLLVGLANVVVNNARRSEPTTEVAANAADNDEAGMAAAGAAKPKEPLAELGVAPASDDETAPVVADLQPDPNLRKPMDRAPAPAQPQH